MSSFSITCEVQRSTSCDNFTVRGKLVDFTEEGNQNRSLAEQLRASMIARDKHVNGELELFYVKKDEPARGTRRQCMCDVGPLLPGYFKVAQHWCSGRCSFPGGRLCYRLRQGSGIFMSRKITLT